MHEVTPDPVARRPLFAYGTLCLPEVRNVLLRRAVATRPGTLRAAEVRGVVGEIYPTIVLERPDHVAKGLVLDDLTAAESAVLRAFEPEVYEVVTVAVETVGGEVHCDVYAHRGGLGVTDRAWTPEGFRSDGLATFRVAVERAVKAIWSERPFDLGSHS